MNLSIKERKIILNWFDIALECDNLGDSDLRLYDKIRETVQDDEDSDDPLVFNPTQKKNSSDDDNDYEEEEEFHYDMDEYSDEDNY